MKAKSSRRALSVPDKHQLKIARATLKMSDAGALVMGGMTKERAREVILRLTGKPAKEEPEVEVPPLKTVTREELVAEGIVNGD